MLDQVKIELEKIVKYAREYEQAIDNGSQVDKPNEYAECVLVKSNWQIVGDNQPPDEYRVVLKSSFKTSVLLQGDLYDYEPYSAKLIYSDGSGFQTFEDHDKDDDLLTFAGMFYFGGHDYE